MFITTRGYRLPEWTVQKTLPSSRKFTRQGRLWGLDQLLNKGLTLFLEEILDFTHKHFYGPKCQQQVRDCHPRDHAYWEPNFQNGMFTR